MTVEQIAIRQEVRQMLSEAGINKDTLKEMVKEVLSEEVGKACKQAVSETNVNNIFLSEANNVLRKVMKEEIQHRINGVFNHMSITIDILDKDGQSSITK